MAHRVHLGASSVLSLFVGVLGMGAITLTYAACTDYVEPPLLTPAQPVDPVFEDDAEAPRVPSREAGGEPQRHDAGRPVDGGALDADGPVYPMPPPLTGGHLYYTFGNKVFRIAAERGARPESVSAALDRFGSPGVDTRITASRDSRWMLLTSGRFGGVSNDSLVLVPSDLSRVEVVRPGGQTFAPQGVAAISPGAGDLIVYAASTGPHVVDIFATRRQGSRWSAPVLLTGASTYPYNNMPALTLDGTRATFDCGQNAYPETGNNDGCSVNVDGTGFRRLVTATTLPGARQSYVQNPHEGADGLYFEAAWPVPGRAVPPEIIWMLPKTGGVPVPVQPADNAVSPCGLPDGRYAMLWLAGPGNQRGDHELAVQTRGGTAPIVLTPGVDVTDIGIGCGD
jgi:hypothetical protein